MAGPEQVSPAYEIIVPSASRSHLLTPTLATLLASIDQLPRRLLVHDDPVFVGHSWTVAHLVGAISAQWGVSSVVYCSPMPKGHGPALHWLLNALLPETEYVLYSQDDFETLRPLPIRQALMLMHQHGLHQIRFNKRDTLPWKDTRSGRWEKKEIQFSHRHKENDPSQCFCPLGCNEGGEGSHVCHSGPCETPKRCSCSYREPSTLTVSDHWYFQTGLWRVRPVRNVVNWLMMHLHWRTAMHEHVEIKINQVLNGEVPEFPSALATVPPRPESWDQATRAQYQRTFIWGGIDEKAFVRHLGGDPKDFALQHNRLELGGGLMHELQGKTTRE